MNAAENTNLATRQAGNVATIKTSNPLGIFHPANLGEAMQYADILSKSSLVPACYRGKTGDILIAADMGMRLGMGFAQSLQAIAVINGRPTLWGDDMLGLVRQQRGLLVEIEEWQEGEGDAAVAICTVIRRGEKIKRQTFSVADAKRAKLWGKAGPWTDYPQRMLKMRARSWLLRDVFPDVLRGLMSAEEAMDIPEKVVVEIAPGASRTSQARAILAGAQAPPVALPEAPAVLTVENATGDSIAAFALERKGLGKDAVRALIANVTGGSKLTKQNLGKVVESVNALSDLGGVGAEDDVEALIGEIEEETVTIEAERADGTIINAEATEVHYEEAAPQEVAAAVTIDPQIIADVCGDDVPEQDRTSLRVLASERGLSGMELRGIIKEHGARGKLTHASYAKVTDAILARNA